MSDDKIILYLTRHEQFLQHILVNAVIPAQRIYDATNYALFPAGKRLRPLLVYFFGELLGIDKACLDLIAASIELTHCYSLVHDDLPAMDNDDFRRGKPSCHRAFDEATAILVGDGMQVLAIEILLMHLPTILSPTQVIAVTRELLKASGNTGMVSGQSLDLSELSKPCVDDLRLRFIHTLKTGKLISACANMVLAACTISDKEIHHALIDYASYLGLVFQMQDDYLDYYADISFLGKRRSSDVENQKVTFAHIYSKKDLEELINHHYKLAKNALTLFHDNATALLKFTDFLQQRSTC
jgi:farnesyl diphosphate synthase